MIKLRLSRYFLFEQIIRLTTNFLDRQEWFELALINKQCFSMIAPKLWGHVTIRKWKLKSPKIVLVLLHQHYMAKHVHTLELSGIWFDRIVLDLVKAIPELQTLIINPGLKLNEDCFYDISPHCKHLYKLDLTQCRTTFGCIETLASRCPLGQVRIAKHNWAGYNLFGALGSGMTSIEIDDCGSQMYGMNQQDAMQDLMRFNRLMCLKIRGNTTFPLLPTTDLTKVWPRLKEFQLDRPNVLNEQQIIALIKSHPKLTLLCVNGGQLTDATLEAITIGLPEIKTLRIDFNPLITATALHRLILACPLLDRISIAKCQLVAKDLSCHLDDEPLLKLDRRMLASIRKNK